jgi:pimeloyl-ACP methyl ester carboxylesterase
MTRVATTSDGARIHYDSAGAGPALLLVHGLGDDRLIWRTLRVQLSTSFTTVALDLRGHGESTGGSDYDPFALHRDIDAVVAAERLERPFLIGHSLGGVAVSTYAARRPVSGVINVDQRLELSGLATSVRRLEKELQERPAHEVTMNILREIGLGSLEASVIEQLQHTRARLAREVLLGIWQPLFASPEELALIVQNAFGGIRAPYLSLHGADPGPDYPAWLSGLVPGAAVEIWEGAGHFPHLTSPERFLARVASFMGGKLGPG